MTNIGDGQPPHAGHDIMGPFVHPGRENGPDTECIRLSVSKVVRMLGTYGPLGFDDPDELVLLSGDRLLLKKDGNGEGQPDTEKLALWTRQRGATQYGKGDTKGPNSPTSPGTTNGPDTEYIGTLDPVAM